VGLLRTHALPVEGRVVPVNYNVSINIAFMVQAEADE
jgi:hypothetical protein